MTPERINLVIAQHLPNLFGVHQESKEVYLRTNPIQTCDICHNLNVTIQVVKEIILGDWDVERAFLKYLNVILERRADDDSGLVICEWEMAQITADAQEFCEALLRTIGKWEDE